MRVDREVHHDLIELAGVRAHGSHLIGECDPQLDRRPDQAAEQLFDVGHHAVGIDDFGCQDLAASWP
ncbi:MAG: hypothetical protein WEE89_04455 [Gemmatimonadota bacterium]